MIEFLRVVWESISAFFVNLWNTASVWFDPAIETLKALGIGGIALLVGRYVLPKILERFNPLNITVNTLLAKLDALSADIAADRLRTMKVEDILTRYLDLSCETNANSRSLTPEQKEKYATLARDLRNIGAVEAAEKIEAATADGVVTAAEVIEIAKEVPVVEQILESTPEEIKTQVDAARTALNKR